MLGSASRLRGEPREAQRWLAESLSAARAAGLREVAGRALFNTGAIAHELGEMDRAEQLYGDALADMRAIGDGYGIARVLHGLGMVRNQAGAQAEAVALLEQARDIKLRMGDPVGAANTEHTLALILLARGETSQARGLLVAILDATAQHGERVSRAHYLDSLAMTELAGADPASARAHLAEAASIAAEVGHPSLGAMISLHTAFAALAAGQLDVAVRLARECAQEAAGHDRHAALAIELAALTALLALAAGDRPGARDHAAAMASLAESAGDARYRNAAGRIEAAVTAAAAGPPPPQELPRLLWVAAAQLTVAGKRGWQERSHPRRRPPLGRGEGDERTSAVLVSLWLVATGSWLALLALVTVATRRRQPHPAAATLSLRGEPPAVVSLLAGQLKRTGYPATVLDLAARGWFALSVTGPGQVTCRVQHGPPPPAVAGVALTAYESRVLAHVRLRADAAGFLPGAALGTGFDIGDKEFAEEFRTEVRADATGRGLIRPRISAATLVLLAVAGLPAAAVAGIGLLQHDKSALLFVPVGYFAVLTWPSALRRGFRLTAAGHSVLAQLAGLPAGPDRRQVQADGGHRAAGRSR